MRQYITRRLLQMIPIAIGVSFIIYMIISAAPGDAVTALNLPHMTPAKEAHLRHLYGLDKPKIVQYLLWLKNAVGGNLGMSSKLNQPVATVIGTYIWNSFYLQIVSFILSLVIAIPIGVVSAVKQYSKFDSFFTILALLGLSLPVFFLGGLLINWLAIDVKIFPVGGMTSTGSNLKGGSAFIDVLKHMVLPVAVLTFGSIASWMRYVRSNMLEVIRQDYVRTARSKGLKEKVVVYKHALRNAMIPVITLIGMSISGLFGGAVITESIFAWPGIGKLTVSCVLQRDYPILMGINMLLAVLTLLGNLLSDIMYALVDPRIRLK